MQLIRVSDDGPRFIGDLVDRERIERADLARVWPEGSPHLHRTRPPLFERCVVEERVRVGIENLVGERRWLRRIDGDRANLTAVDRRENRLQASHIHRLVQAIPNGLVHERVVGDPNVADQVLGARRLIRKHRCEQVVGPHTLNRRRHLPAAGEPQDRQRSRHVPAPPGCEHRRVEQRLRQHRLNRVDVQKSEDDFERKAMLLAE